jgi:hypothetical protein
MASKSSIQTAMINEINKQGPSNVSKHCADPGVFCVVDVGDALLPGAKGQRFVDFAAQIIPQYPGGQYIDERSINNNCFHLALDATASAAFPSAPPKCVIPDGRQGTCLNTNDCRNGMEPVPDKNEPAPNCNSFPAGV